LSKDQGENSIKHAVLLMQSWCKSIILSIIAGKLMLHCWVTVDCSST